MTKSLKSALRHQAGYFLTTIIQSALPLLLLPILTSYLSASEYGTIGLYGFYYAFMNALIGASISVYVSKFYFKEDHDFIAKAVSNAVLLVVGLAFCFSLIFACFNKTISLFMGLPSEWVVTLPWVSCAFAIFNLAVTIMRNQKKVSLFSAYKIAHITVNVLISLIMVTVFMVGWQGRVYGITLSLFFACGISLWFLYKNRFLNLSIEIDVMRGIFKQLIMLMPHSLQVLILTQVGVFFVDKFYSRELVGVYYVGFQVSFAVKLLFTALALSWGPFLYKELNEKEIDKAKIAMYGCVLFLLLLFGVAFVNLFAGFMLRLLVTEPFYQAIEFVPWLSVGFFFSGLTVFLTPALVHLDQEKRLSIVSILTACLMIVFNVVLSEFFGYMGIAYAFALAYFFLFIILTLSVQSVLPLPWIEGVKRGFKTIRLMVGEK